MTDLRVQGTDEALEYIREIAAEMVQRFSISHDEAVGRINAHWVDSMSFFDEGAVNILLHDDPENWARLIYFGSGAPLWQPDESLTPLPFTPEGQ